MAYPIIPVAILSLRVRIAELQNACCFTITSPFSVATSTVRTDKFRVPDWGNEGFAVRSFPHYRVRPAVGITEGWGKLIFSA